MKHNLETITDKIRACDKGDVELVDVLVEVNKCQKEVREFIYPQNLGEWIRKNADAETTVGELLTRFVEKEILGEA